MKVKKHYLYVFLILFMNFTSKVHPMYTAPVSVLDSYYFASGNFITILGYVTSRLGFAE